MDDVHMKRGADVSPSSLSSSGTHQAAATIKRAKNNHTKVASIASADNVFTPAGRNASRSEICRVLHAALMEFGYPYVNLLPSFSFPSIFSSCFFIQFLQLND
jgi:hypothetical protein